MGTLAKSLPRASKRSSAKQNTASIAQTKEHLSSLLRRVEKERTEIIVERRGVPIAKIIPMPSAERVSGFGWMKGSVILHENIDGPTGEVWDVTGE